MKMKKLNSFVLALHLIVATLYLLIANFTQTDLSIFYFGSESFVCGLAIYAATKSENKMYSYIHSAFIWLRGLIYVLDDSEIYQTNNVDRLIFVSVFSLVFVIIYYFYEKFNNT